MLTVLQANIAGAAPLARSAEARLAALARLVGDHGVDVVAVQGGVDSNGTPAPVEMLGALLPHHAHVARHAGMAVFARVAMEPVDVVALTGLGLDEDPSARHLVVVRLPEHALVLAVAHFSWVDAQAQRNVADAAAALDGHGDALLLGDFNQQPDSAALAALNEAGFSDPWPRLRADDPGPTFEIGKRWGRLDYVLERAGTPLVAAIELLAAEPEDAVSDHALLLARVDR